MSSDARVNFRDKQIQGFLVCLTWKVVTGPATFLLPRSGRASGLIITMTSSSSPIDVRDRLYRHYHHTSPETRN